MPITQTRVIALVRAAKTWLQAFEAAATAAEMEIEAITRGQTDAPTALANIQAAINDLRPKAEVSQPIFMEEAHFREHTARNDRMRNRMAIRRSLTAQGLTFQDPRRKLHISKSTLLGEAEVLHGMTPEQRTLLAEAEAEPLAGPSGTLSDRAIARRLADGTLVEMEMPDPLESPNDLDL